MKVMNWIRVLWLNVLDMKGTDDSPSFTKNVLAVVLVNAVCAKTPMPTSLAALLLAAAFGRPVFLAVASRLTLNVSDSTSKVEQTITTVTRNEALGHQDTP